MLPSVLQGFFCNLKVKALWPLLLLFPLLLYITCLRCTFRPLYVSYSTLFLKFPPKQSTIALWIFLFSRRTHSSICHTVLMCQHVAYCRVCFDLGFSKWGHQSSFIPKPQRPSRLQLLSPCSGSSDTDKSFRRRSGDVWADAWCTANAHSSVIVSVQGHHINDISMTRKKKLLVLGKECVRGGWCLEEMLHTSISAGFVHLLLGDFLNVRNKKCLNCDDVKVLTNFFSFHNLFCSFTPFLLWLSCMLRHSYWAIITATELLHVFFRL